MKTTFIFYLCILVSATILGQETLQEVQTNVLKTPDLITYVAENYPASDAQQVVLVIETDTEKMSTDQRFFLEQGLKLLLKRMQEDDKIAFATYGYDNQIIMDFTAVDQVGFILDKLASLSKDRNAIKNKDGIDMGYQFVSNNYDEERENMVLLLRNDKVDNYYTEEEKALSETSKKPKKEKTVASHPKIGGAIALTALTILPEILEVIKD